MNKFIIGNLEIINCKEMLEKKCLKEMLEKKYWKDILIGIKKSGIKN